VISNDEIFFGGKMVLNSNPIVLESTSTSCFPKTSMTGSALPSPRLLMERQKNLVWLTAGDERPRPIVWFHGQALLKENM
jgi:hypothetical protein